VLRRSREVERMSYKNNFITKATGNMAKLGKKASMVKKR
jgi:hypothetical protein